MAFFYILGKNKGSLRDLFLHSRQDFSCFTSPSWHRITLFDVKSFYSLYLSCVLYLHPWGISQNWSTFSTLQAMSLGNFPSQETYSREYTSWRIEKFQFTVKIWFSERYIHIFRFLGRIKGLHYLLNNIILSRKYSWFV